MIPPAGARYVAMALRDPEARPHVEKLLRRGDPSDAVADQVERDILEVLMPSGKIVVFKRLAIPLAQKVLEIRNAIDRALPHQPTQEGQRALAVAVKSKDPGKALTRHYGAMAAEILAPGSSEEAGLAGIDWTGVAIGLAPAAIGLIGSVLPSSIGSVFTTVGSSLSGALKGLFGSSQAPGAAAPPPPPPQTTVQYVESSLSSALPWLIGGGIALFALTR